MTKRAVCGSFVVFLLSIVVSVIPCMAEYNNVLAAIGKNDAIIVKDRNGKVVLSKNENSRLVPASTLKVLTSLAAFHYLGEDYRFHTDFFLDNKSNLIIKGHGDPLLVSEVISKACEDLKDVLFSETDKINSIIIDPSYFEPIEVPGASKTSYKPYNAPIGSTSANFNTISFFRDKNSLFQSSEEQTPLFSFMIPLIKESGLSKGRIQLKSEYQYIYTGSLFRFFLEKNGVTVSDKEILVEDTGKRDKKRIYHLISPFTVKDAVKKLLEHSNNYIANQLLVSIGAHVYDEPGNLDKGSKAVFEFTSKQLDTTDYNVVEGSGLSRMNSVSARIMSFFLDEFKAHRTLMKSNTMAYYKTGTLTGVSTRVGFFESEDDVLYSYVIFTNTPGKSAGTIEQLLYNTLPKDVKMQ